MSASLDGSVRVWDARTGEEIAQPQGETELVSRIQYSPDGRLLVSAGEDQAINVWSTTDFEPLSYSPLTATVPLYSLAISPDSDLIAAGGGRGADAGGFAMIWDAESGEQLVRQALHDNVVFDITFSADGETLHTVSVDGSAGEIDVESGASSSESLFPELGITSVGLGSDGVQLAS